LGNVGRRKASQQASGDFKALWRSGWVCLGRTTVATRVKARNWRARAEELFAIAQEMTYPETRAKMLSLAAEYQKRAEQAEQRERVLREVAKFPPPGSEGKGSPDRGGGTASRG
jgi:hypothetical protein